MAENPKPASLRAASYNIHRAVGTDRRRDPARIAAVLDEIRADVIGLQEVDWHHDHDRRSSQLECLAHMSGYQAVAGPNILDHRGDYGNVLLTRMTVTKVRRIDLREPKREPRGAIDVDLLVGRAPLRVIVTHFGLGMRERWRQSRRLRNLIEGQAAQPTLLLGDFNDWLPGSPTLRPLSGLCGRAAPPASYPSFWPLLALDRILACASPSMPSVRAHTSPLARKASDHLPIIAEIEMQGII